MLYAARYGSALRTAALRRAGAARLARRSAGVAESPGRVANKAPGFRRSSARCPLKPTVFIHTNDKQLVGALVSAYSLKRNSAQAEAFEVRILHYEEHGFFAAREGQLFLRDRGWRGWDSDDLQSFTPLRFMPPALMGYQGRALIIDPDVFAVGEVWDLLARDMGGKAILCVPRPGHNDRADYLATSVMLLDCAKLGHWQVERDFNEMFEGKRDYVEWIDLGLEPRATIGLLGPEWNDFDHLDERTRLLHNTKRRTQPWKTGLPIDFTVRPARLGANPASWVRFAKQRLLGDGRGRELYRRHPDPRQERHFVELLGECVAKGTVSRALLKEHMAKNNLRHDILALIDAARPLAAE